jgi:hypothetical protein
MFRSQRAVFSLLNRLNKGYRKGRNDHLIRQATREPVSAEVLFPTLPPARVGSSDAGLVQVQKRRTVMNELEMKAELEKLRAENATLKKKETVGLSLKVSEKGAVSLYGMGRFPVTLYKEQWLRILASAELIEAFITENDSKLKSKE